MNDRQKTLAAVAIIVGFVVLVVLIVFAALSRKSIISPVPDENAIKIIFITPTPTLVATPTQEATPTPTGTKTKITPTPKKTPSPTQSEPTTTP